MLPLATTSRTLRIARCALIASLLFGSTQGCGPEESPGAYLTFTTALSTFRTTVVADGPLEAKVSHTLTCPRVWPQPKIAFLVPEGARVEKDELVVQLEAKQIELNHANALRELEMARSQAQKKEAELNMERFRLQSQLQSAEAAAAIGQLQLPRLEFVAPRIRELRTLELARSDLQMQKLRKKLAGLEAIQTEERTHFQLKIKQERNKLDKAQEALDKLQLRAPVAGLVVYDNNRSTGKKVQKGDAVRPRMSVARIPDLRIMQVKVKIGETETQKLEEGQTAEIMVPSLGDLRLDGRVAHIDRMAKPIRRDSKIKKVEVIVEIDSVDVHLTPGVTARAEIVVEEVDQAMVVPLECVFERDSLEVVYVRRARNFAVCEVEVTHKNADFAVIQGELEEGEELALHEPSHDLIEDRAPNKPGDDLIEETAANEPGDDPIDEPGDDPTEEPEPDKPSRNLIEKPAPTE